MKKVHKESGLLNLLNGILFVNYKASRANMAASRCLLLLVGPTCGNYVKDLNVRDNLCYNIHVAVTMSGCLVYTAYDTKLRT